MNNKKDNKEKHCAIHVGHMIPMGPGGISSFTVNLYDLMPQETIKYSYLLFRDQKEFFEDRVMDAGCSKIILDTSRNNSLMKFLKKFILTGRLIKKNGIDIMHIDASTPYDVMIALSCKMHGVSKVILHAHNDNYEKSGNKIRNFLIPFFRKLTPLSADYFFACSDQAARFMFSSKIIKEKKYRVIKNGIDSSRFVYNSETRKKIREQLSLEDKFVVGHVGRFVEQKNHKFLLDVFANILKKEPNAVLLLIGEGELEDAIRKKSEELGIKEKVIFYGTSYEINNLLQAMDVFVFPSLFEGLGIVVIEAQAAALKIVCADTIPKEADISDYCVYVPLSQSPEKWAEAVISFKSGYARKDMSKVIKDNGYDLMNTAEWLAKFYIKIT